MIISPRRILQLALLSLAAAAGCGQEPCVTQTTQYTASINVIGSFGATLGQPVARFDLTQDFITHTPYEACAQGPLQDVGVVRLKVTSMANQPLAISFDVQGLNADSLPVWKQPLVIPRIAPGQTLDLGDVTATPTELRHGALIVLSAVTVVN